MEEISSDALRCLHVSSEGEEPLARGTSDHHCCQLESEEEDHLAVGGRRGRAHLGHERLVERSRCLRMRRPVARRQQGEYRWRRVTV